MLLTNIHTKLSKTLPLGKYTNSQLVRIYEFYLNHPDYTVTVATPY